MRIIPDLLVPAAERDDPFLDRVQTIRELMKSPLCLRDMENGRVKICDSDLRMSRRASRTSEIREKIRKSDPEIWRADLHTSNFLLKI